MKRIISLGMLFLFLFSLSFSFTSGTAIAMEQKPGDCGTCCTFANGTALGVYVCVWDPAMQTWRKMCTCSASPEQNPLGCTLLCPIFP